MNLNFDGAATSGNHLARLDGAADVLWEPLWRLQIALHPVEQALLRTWPLRRLHFLHHAGAAYLSMPHTFSRLQHVLGVFALAVHFHPDDGLLRLAALLHDVGHAPFSHTLEQLDGVDHHRWTAELLHAPPVVDCLRTHDLDPQRILARIEGQPANLLRNSDNILHLDHLDSWVRSAQTSGLLPLSPPEILAQLRPAGAYLTMDVALAELLMALIVAEARFHTAAVNLGVNTILARLVKTAVDAGALALERLPAMTDAMVERRLFETPATAETARRLWSRPHEIVVRNLETGVAPPEAFIAPVERLYLAMPLVNGRPVTEVSPRAAALAAEAEGLLGQYAVFWR